MSSLFRQSLAIGAANLKSVPRRIWISLSMMLSVALVVSVLLGFLAMSQGFRQTLENAGSPEVAIVLGPGASSELGSRIEPTQLHLMQGAPGIMAAADASALVSPELVVPVDAVRRSNNLAATLSLRGVGDFSLDVRPGVAISEGRMLKQGSAEILVGRRIATDYTGFDLGQTVTFGSSKWQIVGIFDDKGSAFESEILASGPVVQSLFTRPGLIQSLRVRLTSPGALKELVNYSASEPQLGLTVMSERSYLADQSSRISRLILLLGWPLALIMALGAAVGALNTMYGSVSDRTTEIATLRAMGFSRSASFLGTWIEAMGLTAAGTVAGIGLSCALLDGWTASTLGPDNMQIGFRLSLTIWQVMQAAGLAFLIGAIGGGLPAFRAARLPLRLAMAR